jgi:GNAT superfamily N-acetyltransferase
MDNIDKHSLDAVNNEIIIRTIEGKDSISELTTVLHIAYKKLKDMGLEYVATHQSEETTRKRIELAYKCYVAEYDSKIIGTICLYAPKQHENSKWYSNSFVSKFGQFAVDPSYQNFGIGSKLIDIVETSAREIQGVTELSLDTAETANHLIAYYGKKGFRYIEHIKWDMTNYKSVIMSKKLY